MFTCRKLPALIACLVVSGLLSTAAAFSAEAAGMISYTYSVATRGAIRSDVTEFAARAQATYDDQRGWGLGGSIGFVRVPTGGSFTLWLAEANQVPSFSSVCSSAAVTPSGGPYDPVSPTRVLDTRSGLGAPAGCLGPGRTLDVEVAGLAGVPTSNVGAVAINLTAVSPTDGGYATVSPMGGPNPESSNLNFGPGQTVTNFAMVQVGAAGRITISNVGGYTYYLVDVVGFIPSGSSIITLAPTRLLDTRAGVGAPRARITASQELNVPLAGVVVPTDAQAVLVNLTVVSPSSAGYATAFPSDGPRPGTSTLNFGAGSTVANFALAKLGGDGRIKIFNAGGTADYLIDVLGYVATGFTLTTPAPARVLDTRIGTGAAQSRVTSGGTVGVQMAGTAGAGPADGDVVAINLTAAAPDSAGYASVFGGPTPPETSNLNFSRGQTVAGFALVKTGSDGQLNVLNGGGDADYLVDVAGFIRGP